MTEKNKIKTLEELKEIIENLKGKNKKIVWTNGCFDLIHEGHIKYLKKAREIGDCLVLGLNSDSSIRQIKGPGRPIRPEKARAEIISSFEFVDYVLIFSEVDATKHLSVLKPDVYVKSGNYTLETIHQGERAVVEGYGGKIVLIPSIDDISTSKIIDRIRNSDKKNL